MENLFLSSELTFEKTAAEVEMPEDPNMWPEVLIQELHKQVPYISDFAPHPVMDRVDAEKGYGFGHFEVTSRSEIPRSNDAGQAAAGVKTARIPIVINQRKLQPFDVVVTEDSKMLPLTENRLRQVMFRPQLFDITAKSPGDQSMVGQLYPPFRQNFGFGSGGGGMVSSGMGKEGSTKEAVSSKWVTNRVGRSKASIKRLDEFGDKMWREGSAHFQANGKPRSEAMRQKMLNASEAAFLKTELMDSANTIKKQGSVLEEAVRTGRPEDLEKIVLAFEDPAIRANFSKRKYANKRAVETLITVQPEKTASPLNYVKPTVVQLHGNSDGSYTLKTASHQFWSPSEHIIDRGHAVQLFGEKTVLAADLNEGVTMAEGAHVEEMESTEADKPELVKDYGLYKVHTEDGQELVGWVFPNLIDIDGKPLPVMLFTNGSASTVQGEIVGSKAGEGQSLPQGGQPRGYGVFYRVLPNGKAEATVPVDVQATLGGNNDVVFQAETFSGEPVEIVGFQPNIQTIQYVDGRVLIPENFVWLPLDRSQSVSLASKPEEVHKEAAALRELGSVYIRYNGQFHVDGPALSKVASSEKTDLELNDALFLLAGLGCKDTYAQEKLGQAMVLSAPVQVRIGRTIKTASTVTKQAYDSARETLSLIPNLNKNLVKEAAVIDDPLAVDTVLSLGFIHPENIHIFLEALPVLDESQEKLCELLVASRLGLRDIPSSAVENAIRNLEQVIEGLKTIAFQQN